MESLYRQVVEYDTEAVRGNSGQAGGDNSGGPPLHWWGAPFLNILLWREDNDILHLLLLREAFKTRTWENLGKIPNLR